MVVERWWHLQSIAAGKCSLIGISTTAQVLVVGLLKHVREYITASTDLDWQTARQANTTHTTKQAA
jgi:hypothetical protein